MVRVAAEFGTYIACHAFHVKQIKMAAIPTIIRGNAVMHSYNT